MIKICYLRGLLEYSCIERLQIYTYYGYNISWKKGCNSLGYLNEKARDECTYQGIDVFSNISYKDMKVCNVVVYV